MKKIIAVLSGLLIGYLEATEDTPEANIKEAIVGTENAAGQRSRTSSATSILTPQKTKILYIAHELCFYKNLMDSFKKKVTESKHKKIIELESEFSSALRSACYSDPSFLNEIQEYIKLPNRNFSSNTTILNWLDLFIIGRERQLAKYTSQITDLLDVYVADVDEAARSATVVSFRELLESANDNIDLKDIERAMLQIFSLKKGTDESDEIDPAMDECLQLFLRCLESYKFPNPSRSRAGSFL
jgi:hypothetical protein